jgi:hypothetical protein
LPPKTLKQERTTQSSTTTPSRRKRRTAPPSSRPQWSRVFTRSFSGEKVTTTAPPTGLRHPQASPPLASKCKAFARKNLRMAPKILDRRRPRVRPPKHDLGAATTRISYRLLLAIHMTEKRDHHHRHVARRRVVHAVHSPGPPGPPPRHPRT